MKLSGTKSRLGLLFLGLASCLGVRADGPRYAVIDLGQSDVLIMHSLTDSGNVSWITDTTFCRWQPGDSTFESVSVPDGDNVTAIGGIDDNGDVAGAYQESPYTTPETEGFFNVWVPAYWPSGSSILGAPVFSKIGDPSEGYAFAEVDAIDNDGKMYGVAQLTSDYSDGVTWDSPTSSPAAMDFLPGQGNWVEWAKNGHTLGQSSDVYGFSSWYLDGTAVSYNPISINTAGDAVADDRSSGECSIQYADGDSVVIPFAERVRDMNAAELPMHNSDGSVTMVECPQVTGMDQDYDYAIFQQNPDTGVFSDDKINSLVPADSGFTGIYPQEINDSGVISATGRDGSSATHALLLVPVQVTQNNYPTTQGVEDLGPATTQNIIGPGGTGIAYITGAPAMPQLTAQICGGGFAGSGMTVDWRLHMTTETTHRGSKDDMDIPASSGDGASGGETSANPVGGPGVVNNEPINQPWTIEYPPSPFEFNGGIVTLYFTIRNAGGTALGPEQSVTFKIRGKNPTPSAAYAYIQAEPEGGPSGNLYYAWGIAKHESAQDPNTYCQFNTINSSSNPLELPQWGSPDGWGIFQRDDSGEGIYVATDEVYSWQVNSDICVQEELAQEWNEANNYLGNLQSKYPIQFTSPPTYTASGRVFAATMC